MLLPSLSPAPQSKRITVFLKKTLKQAKHTKAIIALSGGIDSATSLALAVQALGSDNVYALKLPYGQSHPQLLEQANLVIKHYKIPKKNALEVNIAPGVDKLWETILVYLSKTQTGNARDLNQIRLGNVMARIRMIYLYDTAKTVKALVIGTENRSEHLLGYFTRFGDTASDIEPIRHLYKTQLKQLAAHLKVPPVIIDQAPTAGLWVDQTDEIELGFSYEVADQILYLHFDQKMSPKDIVKRLVSEDKTKPERSWHKTTTLVLDRVNQSLFKHQLPHTLMPTT